MRQLPALWIALHITCVICGAQVAHLELVAPGRLPARWARWNAAVRRLYTQCRDPAQWWLIVESEHYTNGTGENITAEHAAQMRDAFAYPRRHTRVRNAALPGDAGFCPHCDVPYCPRHWTGPSGQERTCPLGHTP
ncbi:hypothetical protein [Streptomyces chrestomyceticus]|uniref:hypothetical protein n=1 Tax=Streptomyces chrestomyceticus TaxID=68185 RepID=UPI0004C7201C